MEQTAKGNVSLYVVLVFAFCTLTYFFHPGPMAAMWGPAVAAIIASLLRRRSLKRKFGDGALISHFDLLTWCGNPTAITRAILPN